MNETRVSKRALFDNLPGEWAETLLPTIQQTVRDRDDKLIVLDDDPTGTQTVHHVPVLTEWPVERLVEELSGPAPVIFLLTNSRSLPLAQAQALNYEIGARLREAAAGSKIGTDRITIISRSDSTLRGHFPGEVTALAEGLRANYDALLVVPFFPEGGRYTINDIHYVADGDWLVPAGETEFARDKSFGYRASNLREWVAEKTAGKAPVEQVASIALEDLRQGGPEIVTRKLLQLPKGTICIANAASDRDLEVLVMGLLQAEARGRRYLYRTAASFVRVRGGIAKQSLLTRADLNLPEQGAGLVVVGSYVPRTSAQLEALFNQTGIQPVALDVPRLLDETTRDDEIERAQAAVNQFLANGKDTALYTTRQLVSTEAAEAHADANLAIGKVVSDGLVRVIKGLDARPRYLLAKGGITSSDVATRGLGIRRAVVLGQILPGVPVWEPGAESRFPGMPYIIFPGNVGDAEALAKVVKELGD